MFLEAKKADGMRPRYLGDLRVRLLRFIESFGTRKLSDITAAELGTWLRNLGVGASTRNAFRQTLNVLYAYARGQSWVTDNPVTNVSKAKTVRPSPGILTIEETARVLETASEETLPIFAIGCFAGLRSAELEKLEWHHIKFDAGLVEVPATSSKTASRRLVEIRPNLAQWLEPYRGKHGPICPPGYYRQMVKDRRKAGLTRWPSNCMRHSYASYHLAAFHNAPHTSLELGHVTPQMVFAHYRELVTPSEAQRFWHIVPMISAEPKIALIG
jgi:integrase